MDTIILAIYIAVCISLIGMILIQQGKGADAGANFGGGSSGGASDSVFGSQGSGNFLSKTTAILATTFFCIALFLSYSSGTKIKKKSDSLIIPTTAKVEKTSAELEIPALPTMPSIPNDVIPADKSETKLSEKPTIPTPASNTE